MTPWNRLPVLLAPHDPALAARLTVMDYARTLRLLGEHYGLVLLDCGPSLTHPLTRFALDVADHVVLVTGPDSTALHGAHTAYSSSRHRHSLAIPRWSLRTAIPQRPDRMPSRTSRSWCNGTDAASTTRIRQPCLGRR